VKVAAIEKHITSRPAIFIFDMVYSSGPEFVEIPRCRLSKEFTRNRHYCWHGISCFGFL